MFIVMNENRRGSSDGIHVQEFEQGQKYEIGVDISSTLANIFLENGDAEETLSGKKMKKKHLNKARTSSDNKVKIPTEDKSSDSEEEDSEDDGDSDKDEPEAEEKSDPNIDVDSEKEETKPKTKPKKK